MPVLFFLKNILLHYFPIQRNWENSPQGFIVTTTLITSDKSNLHISICQ